MCRERPIPAAISVEGMGGVVRLRAVHLEREPRFRAVDVQLVAGHADVELRLGKGALVDESLQPALALGAQEVRLGSVGREDTLQALPPPLAQASPCRGQVSDPGSPGFGTL